MISNPVSEKFEVISYNPGINDSGNLETATRTITAAEEASGTGNADYSKAFTLPVPADVRLELQVVGVRLACTIDSMTAGHLYCRVYVDQQDADHRLMDMDWTSAGAKLNLDYPYPSYKSTIFNLLKDGTPHTFYFFFRVDSGNAVISLVQLWEGIGGSDNAVLKLTHTGFVWANARLQRIGTGTPTLFFRSCWGGEYQYTNDIWKIEGHDVNHPNPPLAIIKDTAKWEILSTINTDLAYIARVMIVLRSE